MRGEKSMLVKIPFDFENMEKIPSWDEKIELDGSFGEWQGKKVTIIRYPPIKSRKWSATFLSFEKYRTN